LRRVVRRGKVLSGKSQGLVGRPIAYHFFKAMKAKARAEYRGRLRRRNMAIVLEIDFANLLGEGLAHLILR